MLKPVQVGKQIRYSYAKTEEVIEIPNLLDIQRNSYKWFLEEGLKEIFRDISPVSDAKGKLELLFEEFNIGNPKRDIEECRKHDVTYSIPLYVKVKLLNKVKGNIKEQEIFFGNIPYMTSSGTFIVNGAERVVVSQLIRSPGVYYSKSIDKTGKNIFNSTVIPNRGAWLESETDSSNNINIRIDRTRKVIATNLLRAIDLANNEDILKTFDVKYFIMSKLSEEKTTAQLIEFLSTNDEGGRDIRDILIKKYVQDSNKEEEDFEGLLEAFSQLDENNNSLSNYRYLLEKLALLDSQNDLVLMYKALVDQLDADTRNGVNDKDCALIEIYSHLRPSEPPSAGNAEQLLYSLLFDPRRYDLAGVGRYKITKKLGWRRRILGKILAEDISDPETGEILLFADKIVTQEELDKIPEEREAEIFGLRSDEIRRGYITPISIKIKTGCGKFTMLCSPTLSNAENRTLCVADIVSAIGYLFDLMSGVGQTDDIDNLGNRRVRCVGELLQNQFRVGMLRLERIARERMTTQDIDTLMPQNVINVRPIVAIIKEFFGSSQLSQFMDQNNPLSELTHKRRLSALGVGGLNRDRAGFEVRDVHTSHYGRMCPIETPEGANIGLIGSLSNYARVNKYGFIETPYRKVDKVNKRVTDKVYYFTADEEETLTIAQANEPLDQNKWFINERVVARRKEGTKKVHREKVDYMDVSPKQVISVATALIPFLENDDSNRALMGANMQRQAVPLLRTQAPVVGTGMEYKAACDSGVMILAKRPGTVVEVDAKKIKIQVDSNFVNNPSEKFDIYNLRKFIRSNQDTCMNQTPIVNVKEHVEARQPIADGTSTSQGELALGYNVIVAYMPWEGYNYEDAILINENLIKRDIYTSVHIEEYQCDSRDMKIGSEEITRDIPNVSAESLSHLDENGIIAVGSNVKAGDILVGKVTPKGVTELSPEERLLRSIFGANVAETRDTSLRVPHGVSGKVIKIQTFTRKDNVDLPSNINKQVKVYIAQKRKLSIGDKMSGRHGNKGVVSEIRRQEDMPFLPDGTPVDIVLNPLGVPSRMNIGQILEAHLGMAAYRIGLKIKSNDKEIRRDLQRIGINSTKDHLFKVGKAGINFATPVFDGAQYEDILEVTKIAKLDEDGKTILYDGRTGEPFENRVTVGCVYMLKLHHLVDDKMHARSVGSYSLITQQPLGGKAQFGGQRFGEMEVWALEAYGASYTLQEILTVKSDNVVGRFKTYEALVRGQDIPKPSVPESFKVLMKELQSVGLDVKILNDNSEEVILHEDEDDNSYRIFRKYKNEKNSAEAETIKNNISAEELIADTGLIESKENNIKKFNNTTKDIQQIIESDNREKES